MFSFLKPKLEFTEFKPKERLEKIVEKYLLPKLRELEFTWVKEERFSDEVLEIIKTHTSTKLSPHQEFHSQYFERKRGNLLDRLTIERSQEDGEFGFSSEFSIDYFPYDQWHKEHFSEEPIAIYICCWRDNDRDITNKLGSKYRRVIESSLTYDLNRYTTEKIMRHFLDQTINIRIPLFEKYETLDDLILFLKSKNKPNHYEQLFDLLVMNSKLSSAGETLKWAEKRFKLEDSDWQPDEYFQMRLNLLKKITK